MGASIVHVRNDDESPTSDPERLAHFLEGLRTQFFFGGRSGAGYKRAAPILAVGSIFQTTNRNPKLSTVSRCAAQ